MFLFFLAFTVETYHADSRKCMCVSTFILAFMQKLQTFPFFLPKRCLTNTPRRQHLTVGHRSSSYPPSPSFSSVDDACVMLCYFPPPSSTTASRLSVHHVSCLQKDEHLRSRNPKETVCDHRQMLKKNRRPAGHSRLLVMHSDALCPPRLLSSGRPSLPPSLRPSLLESLPPPFLTLSLFPVESIRY